MSKVFHLREVERHARNIENHDFSSFNLCFLASFSSHTFRCGTEKSLGGIIVGNLGVFAFHSFILWFVECLFSVNFDCRAVARVQLHD